jgi:hypothetical protein
VIASDLLIKLQKLDQDKIIVTETKQGKTLHIRSLRKLSKGNQKSIILTPFSGFALSVSGVVSRLQRIKLENAVLVQYQTAGPYWEVSDISEDKDSDMVTIRLGRRVTDIDDSDVIYIKLGPGQSERGMEWNSSPASTPHLPPKLDSRHHRIGSPGIISNVCDRIPQKCADVRYGRRRIVDSYKP